MSRRREDVDITALANFDFRDIATMRQSLRRAKELKQLTSEQLTLIGHRGMGPSSVLGPRFDPAYVFPENSIESFKNASLLGADGIELDIFMSKDGHIMVIHDDELWRNVYGNDRKGQALPKHETQQSYKVGQKTLVELKALSIGPNGEKIPTLEEVFALADSINAIRKTEGLPPFILNIELKDETAVKSVLEKVQTYEKEHPGTKVGFDSICFCSFHHECLKALKAQATALGIENIQIAPSIKTATLFGAEQVNPDFTVKEGATYDPKGLAYLKGLVEGQRFTAYDAVLWDIGGPLVQLTKAGGKQLHASTSDFRAYDLNPGLAPFLLEASEEVPVYFKSDEVAKARALLIATAEHRNEARQARQEMLAIKEKEERLVVEEAPRFSSVELETHLPKPIPYSRDLQKLQAEKRELEDKLDGAGMRHTTIIEREHMRQRLISINEELRKMQREAPIAPISQDVRQATFLPSYSSSRSSVSLQQHIQVKQERALTTRDDLERRRDEINKQLDGIGVPTINSVQKHKLRLELTKIDEALKKMPAPTSRKPF